MQERKSSKGLIALSLILGIIAVGAGVLAAVSIITGNSKISELEREIKDKDIAINSSKSDNQKPSDSKNEPTAIENNKQTIIERLKSQMKKDIEAGLWSTSELEFEKSYDDLEFGSFDFSNNDSLNYIMVSVGVGEKGYTGGFGVGYYAKLSDPMLTWKLAEKPGHSLTTCEQIPSLEAWEAINEASKVNEGVLGSFFKGCKSQLK